MNFAKSLNVRLFAVYALVLVILLFNGWILKNHFLDVSQQEEHVRRNTRIIIELEMLASLVKDAETAARGYVLSNDNEHLEPYRGALAETAKHFQALRTLLNGQSDQLVSLTNLEAMVKKRFEQLEVLLEKFRHNKGQIDRSAFPFSAAKATMMSIRQQVALMEGVESAKLDEMSKRAENSKSLFYWILGLTTLLSVGVISITFYQIFKNQRRMAIEAEVRAEAALEKEEVADVARLLAGGIALEEAGQRLLEYFSKQFGVLAGRLYMKDLGGLRLTSSFAAGKFDEDLKKNPFLKDSKDSLVTVALNRNDLWEVSQVPSDYWRISSSLGESVPGVLTFIPFSFQNQPLGVFELATFEKLSDKQKHALTQLFETLGVGLNAAQSRAHLQALLEKTQQQSEELQSQQEELRTNNEELEQQARALESQQQALNIKNRELELAKADLEQKASDLEKSSQYKSDFLARMSHELRTPLNGLLILSTLLIENKENNLTEKQKQFAKSIYGAGNDLLMLINDILDLSKIEARKLTLRPETFTLESLLDSKSQTFGPQASAKKLELKVSVADDLKPLRLHTDRQRLEQILRNFLSNSIKFTESGHIILRAEYNPTEKLLDLSVQDTGIGIPREKQQLIFEAFEQGDSSVSRKFGGTGLGLTISRELAHLLGGDVYLQSEEGKGSTFTLRLPIELAMKSQAPYEKSQPEEASPKFASKAPSVSFHENKEGNSDRVRAAVRKSLKAIDPDSKSILIVEDDDKFRSSVVETVKSAGFSAVEASDGEVALAILNEMTPDAILLDIKLPGISGLGILEMIKQMPHLRHIPVHMISALEYQHNALRMGALGYLTKPVTMEKIKSAIGRIENLLDKKLRRVLLIEDDERQSHAISELISGNDLEVTSVRSGKAAVEKLEQTGFDCIILDLSLPDVSGFDLLSELSSLQISLPPIVIYTGKELTEEEESYLRRYSESIIIKGARSPERLLDEVNLFLHRVESLLPVEKRQMLQQLRSQDKSFEGKSILLVDDDIRNIFALTSALEAKGLEIRAARNGLEALEALEENSTFDLVLMDIMMPKMDGFEAMRRIRKNANSRISQVPIVALTAKAMREDHEKCMEAGANDYLPKPVNLDNLTTVLKVWLSPKGLYS